MFSELISRALAIRSSPLGQRLHNALANVDDGSPDFLEAEANVVPFFLNDAIISAGCKSHLFIFSTL